MKPLPNISDESAMAIRGRRSVLGSARNECASLIRDQCTFLQSCDWDEIPKHVPELKDAADRLLTLHAMWGEL
jgi:hypothetical protein